MIAPPSILPVIMCGGAGTRLWPLSVPASPKPFHAFGSDQTLFQDTAARVAPGAGRRFLPPLVICGRHHGALVAEQLEALGLQALAIVEEPCGRNTAAVAAIASQLALERAPGALALLLPADHVIADGEAFRQVVSAAAPVAADHIVTFGVRPDRPETGYGYIQQAAALTAAVRKVARFVEKPDAATAQAYIDSGDYLWNAGIFLFSPAVMLQELSISRRDIVDAALAALPQQATAPTMIALDAIAFAACPAESIDYAVMETTSRAAVAPCDIGWADVGSWSEVWRLGRRDDADNLAQGPVTLTDVRGSLVVSDGPTIAALGVEDLIIVATRDAVVVLPKARAQEIKGIVEGLQRTAAGSQD